MFVIMWVYTFSFFFIRSSVLNNALCMLPCWMLTRFVTWSVIYLLLTCVHCIYESHHYVEHGHYCYVSEHVCSFLWSIN
jgi:hypothetical protein